MDLIALSPDLYVTYIDASKRKMYDIAQEVLELMKSITGDGTIDVYYLVKMLKICISTDDNWGTCTLLRSVTNAKSTVSRLYYVSHSCDMLELLKTEGVVLSVLDEAYARDIFDECDDVMLKYLLRNALLTHNCMMKLIVLYGNDDGAELVRSYCTDGV